MERHDVIDCVLQRDYVLRVRFDDGTEQFIDFEPILCGPLFGPLHDPVLFRQVRVDPDLGTLVWPTGADIDPNVLHDWPNQVEAIAQRRRQRYLREGEDRVDPADFLAILEKAGTDVAIEGDELPVTR